MTAALCGRLPDLQVYAKASCYHVVSTGGDDQDALMMMIVQSSGLQAVVANHATVCSPFVAQ